MSEQVIGLDKDCNGMSKKSVHAYGSAWLGRWTRTGIEAVQPSRSHLLSKKDGKCCKESSVVGPEIAVGVSTFGQKCRDVVDDDESLKENHGRTHGNEGYDVSPLPTFIVSQRRESFEATRVKQNTLCNGFQTYMRKEATLSFHEGEGSSSKAISIRRPLSPPWIHKNDLPAPSSEHTEKLSSNHNPNIPTSSRKPHDLISPVTFYATVGSAEGTSREPFSFAQATRHVLLTRRTDLNLLEDRQEFRGSTVSMKRKGKMFRGFLDISPKADLQHLERGRLQSLGSMKDNEEEGPRKDAEVKSSAVCARNDSSAETDTLEMDNFQRIRLSGTTSPLSPKVEERKCLTTVPRVEIPDMNQEPPRIPDGEKTVDRHGGEASTSETQIMNVEHFTQSMNVERFLSNTELRKECKRVRSDPETCSAWIKRLKMSTSDSSVYETKSMKIGEAAPGEKVSDYFHRIIKSEVTNPEPRNDEPSTSQFKNTKLGGPDMTLLHPWIQRWCKNKAETSHHSAGREVTSEPETSKETTIEGFQKKQFPSIAAMALMGKALSGLSPSYLKKSGSLITWDTPDLR